LDYYALLWEEVEGSLRLPCERENRISGMKATDVWKFDETGDESRLCRREPQASGERKVKEE
jgi:hypothetical protein